MRLAWIRPLVGLALAGLAGCGDNTTDTADACAPEPPPLPTDGLLIDPLAAPLADCVEGGLRDLPGRWFVAAAGAGFSYDYPRYEGSCEAGFRRALRTDDLDASDGRTRHTWSDGTRIFLRSYTRYERQNQPPFEVADAFTACIGSDGALHAHRTRYDTDRGERQIPMRGERFAPLDGTAAGLALLGEVGQQNGAPIEALNVVVDGTHAYVAGLGGLDVIDAAVPTAPVHVGHVDGSFNDLRLVHGGGKAVVYAAPYSGETIAIIDVTDPTRPAWVSSIDEYAHSLQVQTRGATTYLYLANYTNAVPRYDVTSPLTPVRTGEAMVPGPQAGIHDLTVDGDRIFANNTTEGVVAIDVSAGLDKAVELGRRKSPYSHAGWTGMIGGRQILLHGDEGMVDDGGAYLGILDGDPASPTFLQELGRYRTRKQVGIHNIEVSGNKVYLTYYQDGVRVVDLTMPSTPREVAHYNTWIEETAYGSTFEGAVGLRLAGGLIYVADLERGLLILKEQ
jgi:hypothetical protein